LLLWGGDLSQEPVHCGDRLRRGLLARTLRQGRQLRQLEEARNRPVEVADCVQRWLRNPASGPPGGSGNFLPHGPVSGMQPLRWTEHLLPVTLLFCLSKGLEVIVGGSRLLAPLAAQESREDEGLAGRPSNSRPLRLPLQPDREDVVKALAPHRL